MSRDASSCTYLQGNCIFRCLCRTGNPVIRFRYSCRVSRIRVVPPGSPGCPSGWPGTRCSVGHRSLYWKMSGHKRSSSLQLPYFSKCPDDSTEETDGRLNTAFKPNSVVPFILLLFLVIKNQGPLVTRTKDNNVRFAANVTSIQAKDFHIDN